MNEPKTRYHVSSQESRGNPRKPDPDNRIIFQMIFEQAVSILDEDSSDYETDNRASFYLRALVVSILDEDSGDSERAQVERIAEDFVVSILDEDSGDSEQPPGSQPGVLASVSILDEDSGDSEPGAEAPGSPL